ncbi:MAG: hypothetical protein WAW41_10360 [Methylobacter sp.]
MDFYFERFFTAIDLLIELHLQRNKAFLEDKAIYAPEVFAELHATVSIDIGRQTGKTTYIQQHATLEDLVIVQNQNTARRFSKDLNVKTAIQVLKHKDDGSLARFNRVFIDEATWVFKDVDKKTLYKACASASIEQTFICLG